MRKEEKVMKEYIFVKDTKIRGYVETPVYEDQPSVDTFKMKTVIRKKIGDFISLDENLHMDNELICKNYMVEEFHSTESIPKDSVKEVVNKNFIAAISKTIVSLEEINETIEFEESLQRGCLSIIGSKDITKEEDEEFKQEHKQREKFLIKLNITKMNIEKDLQILLKKITNKSDILDRLSSLRTAIEEETEIAELQNLICAEREAQEEFQQLIKRPNIGRIKNDLSEIQEVIKKEEEWQNKLPDFHSSSKHIDKEIKRLQEICNLSKIFLERMKEAERKLQLL